MIVNAVKNSISEENIAAKNRYICQFSNKKYNLLAVIFNYLFIFLKDLTNKTKIYLF